MSQSSLNTNASDNHTTERGEHMTRIRIDDLPVAENLTPEQEELIQGAGLKSFRPSLEALEGREVPATIATGIDVTNGVMRITPSGNDNLNVRLQMSGNQVEVIRSNSFDFANATVEGVTRIEYVGSSGADTFTNLTGLPSTFSNQQTWDVHSDYGNSLMGRVTSPDFLDQGTLAESTRGGDVKLTLPTAPPGTKTWAVIVIDHNAVGRSAVNGKFTHVAAWNIPAGTQDLDLGALPRGAVEGADTWTGPNPPPRSGTHRYEFQVYALGEGFTAPAAGATQQQLMNAMQGHITGQTSITGYMTAPAR
jgi:Raf kinase inhibitor-like YbhB/YbcL family protein